MNHFSSSFDLNIRHNFYFTSHSRFSHSLIFLWWKHFMFQFSPTMHLIGLHIEIWSWMFDTRSIFFPNLLFRKMLKIRWLSKFLYGSMELVAWQIHRTAYEALFIAFCLDQIEYFHLILLVFFLLLFIYLLACFYEAILFDHATATRIWQNNILTCFSDAQHIYREREWEWKKRAQQLCSCQYLIDGKLKLKYHAFVIAIFQLP